MLLFLLGLSSVAQAIPQQLTQQGRLIDANGIAVDGQQVVSFRIYDSLLGGQLIWEEPLVVVFTEGYYSAILGADVINNPIESSLLANPGLHLEVEVDNMGPMSPRQAIKATPFSFVADTAENVSGGTVDAQQIQVAGSLVIDSNGSWVGPTIAVNWGDLQGIPADLADGDDDTLSTISCQAGQILSWNGAAWGCADDNGLTESQVEAFVTNDPIDLAAGSQVGGDTIVTQSTDQDRLSSLGLNCQNGDVPKWDAVLGDWICDIDSDTSDWATLANIPSDIADGDDDTTLTENEVEDFIANGAIDLALGTTVNGQSLLAHSGCNDGEFLLYSNGQLTCSTLTALLDNDMDGVLAWDDCDDADPTAGSNTMDNDCDGTVFNNDCDDYDPTSNTQANDADCDGVLTTTDCDDNDAAFGDQTFDTDCDGSLTAMDCDDTDPTLGDQSLDGDCDGTITVLDCNDADSGSTTLATDADCDGTLTADDCNDNDPTSTILANDADCDGVETAQDCNDSNATLGLSDGSSALCPGTTCATILADYPNTNNGSYYIDPTQSGIPTMVYCDMQNGGWTYQSQGTPFTLSYSGSPETLTTPSTTTEYQFTLYGAQGGLGYYSTHGGNGGMAEGNKSFGPNTTLYALVGGQGSQGTYQDQGQENQNAGGYNGGGRGTRGGSGGGGASDIRLNVNDLNSRIIVAAGGGGCGYNSCEYTGGTGGGLTGGDGIGYNTSNYSTYGATQTSGGYPGSGNSSANGSFGVGADNIQANDEGGGGGGWYGGASGGIDNTPGSGGSSYYDGMDSNQSTTSGVNSGNGYIEYIFK